MSIDTSKQILDESERFIKYTTLHPEYDHTHTDLSAYGKQPIQVVCLKHGLFDTTVHSHLTAKHTCPICKSEHIAKRKSRTHNLTASKRLKWIQEHYTDTKLTASLGVDLGISIFCPEHGLVSVIRPEDSLPSNPPQCQSCSNLVDYSFANQVILNTKLYSDTNSFPQVSSQQGRLTYTPFSKPYPTELPILIQAHCSIHGSFTQDFGNLLAGTQTCPDCDKLN